MQLQGGIAINVESWLGFFHSPCDIAFEILLNEKFSLIKEYIFAKVTVALCAARACSGDCSVNATDQQNTLFLLYL